MRETALNTKIIKLLIEEQTAGLLTITPCYLLMQLLNIGPVAMFLAISVANLMSEATALLMGESVVNVRVLIISKMFVVRRLQQPRQHPAPSRGSRLSHHRGGLPKQKTYKVTFKSSVPSATVATSGGERENGNVTVGRSDH